MAQRTPLKRPGGKARALQRRRSPREHHSKRAGFVAVWFAVLLTLLLGVLGLVIDGGLLFAAHRHAHNAADAAALGAAMDKLRGQPDATATATATLFVQQHNGLPGATVVCNYPPLTGPHAGMNGHVEAIVTSPIQTLFIHFLGINQNQQVTGRAVATYTELRSAGEGAIVLDPRVQNISPGLAVGGQGRLVVQGGVFDNNEGGGVDYLYQTVNPNNSWAATGGQTNSVNGVYSDNIRIVGGVDDPAMFKNIATGTAVPNVLWAGVLPIPDPLINLDTPFVGNGVFDTGEWPDVSIADNGVNVSPAGATTVDATGTPTILWPNVYKQITITGGDVLFMPGIYVISAGGNKGITINGGNVVGEGIMFYNTGANYDSSTGFPDNGDPYDPMGLQPPPSPNQAATQLGDVTLNSSMNLTPIDTQNPAFDYSNYPGIGVFDGMLFYQRRGNAHAVGLQGNGSSTWLAGTIYAKWARFKLQGTAQYDAQFIVGSMDIQGQGDVTLQYTGQGRGNAPAVFLVE